MDEAEPPKYEDYQDSNDHEFEELLANIRIHITLRNKINTFHKSNCVAFSTIKETSEMKPENVRKDPPCSDWVDNAKICRVVNSYTGAVQYSYRVQRQGDRLILTMPYFGDAEPPKYDDFLYGQEPEQLPGNIGIDKALNNTKEKIKGSPIRRLKFLSVDKNLPNGNENVSEEMD
ncbi:unnamed protein product [Gordionus sp. m RMFG-2023]